MSARKLPWRHARSFNPVAAELATLVVFTFGAVGAAMSEEVSSSSAVSTGSKHPREDEGEPEEVGPAKKSRQNDDAGPCTSTSKTGEGVSGEGVTSEGVTGEGVNSESDEEYHLGGSDSEGGFSDEEREDAESSDISAEEEGEEEAEGEGEGDGGNIICGQCVELREIKDGHYRLYHEESGREIKVLLSQDSVTSAEKLCREIQSENQIAVLDAQGAEVTRDERDEVIVYAKSLAAADTKYLFYEEAANQDISNESKGILLHGNKLVVLRVEGIDEVFATGDFNHAQEAED